MQSDIVTIVTCPLSATTISFERTVRSTTFNDIEQHENVQSSLSQLFTELLPLLQSEYWIHESKQFVSYCLGKELLKMISDSLERVLRLFIEILFIRYCHPDDEVGVYPAQKVLLEAQTAWWRILARQAEGSTQISFVEDLSHPDELNNSFDNQTDDLENDFSGDNQTDDLKPNEHNQNSDFSGNDSDTDPSMESDDDEHENPGPGRWDLPIASGLLKHFLEICRPGNLLETSHTDVEISFRYYNWWTSYGQMLVRWTHPEPLQELQLQAMQSDHPFDPLDFLLFFSTHRRMHPWRSNPIAAYLFVSFLSFQVNCHLWLIPCLVTLGFEARGWDLKAVYREQLMRHPILLDPESSTELERLDPLLRTVIVETAKHRRIIKMVDDKVFHTISTATPSLSLPPSSSLYKLASSSTHSPAVIRRATNAIASSPLNKTQQKNQKHQEKNKECCLHKPESDWCIRTVYVQERADAAKYRDFALTSAVPEDRLKPKPIYFEARPADHSVWRDCGHDIVQFMHRRGTEEHMVGGVRFNALPPEALKIMQENHSRVRIKAIRRREEMQRWVYGSMTATGSRIPMGGKKADGYAPYACHTTDTAEDIEALFRHAVMATPIGYRLYPGFPPPTIAILGQCSGCRCSPYGQPQ
ncbi:hypothetical protein B0H16DRAFT_1476961 [Mycena metata]|uniref:Uncharacterized protein n=1 Tax=Mycena metata TaxID=1033252 RepID=A0AAD7HB44_9AGAR|nr:hypothetical protein B0H16DRAFT_1476961 [Mycena metata]